MKKPLQIIILALALLVTACGEPDRPTIGLYPALKRGNIDQIERHIYWGTDLNKPDPDGQMPLHVAATSGRYVVVELLLDSGATIDIQDQQGQTPLYDAIMQGRTKVAQLLIKRGANFDPDQLLLEAVRNQVADRDVISFLVKQGADVNHTGPDGDSPLHIAVKSDFRVLTRLLISHGADVNQKDKSRNTPLWHAVGHHNRAISQLLKKHGAVVE